MASKNEAWITLKLLERGYYKAFKLNAENGKFVDLVWLYLTLLEQEAPELNGARHAFHTAHQSKQEHTRANKSTRKLLKSWKRYIFWSISVSAKGLSDMILRPSLARLSLLNSWSSCRRISLQHVAQWTWYIVHSCTEYILYIRVHIEILYISEYIIE